MGNLRKRNSHFKMMPVSILILFVLLVGCATRPIPENVTKLRTYEISQKIRCELRDAFRGQLRGFFKRRNRSDISDGLRSNQLTYDWAIQNGPRLVGSNNWSVYERYEKGFVAYNYTFDITENNDLTAGVDFLDIFTKGMFKLGVSGHQKRKRRNKTSFVIVDEFGALAIDPVLNRFCKQIGKGTNASYPIAGTLGLDLSLKEFFDLNQSGNLVGFKSDGSPSDTPTRSETIEFTTEISATISPTIELASASTAFKLTKATLSSVNTRKDFHTLILTMTLPKVKTNAKNVDTTARRRAIGEVERQRKIQLDEQEQRANEVVARGL